MPIGDKQEGIESAQGRPEQMVRVPLGTNNLGPPGGIECLAVRPAARALAPIMFTVCSPSSSEDETIPSSPFHAQGSIRPLLLHYHFGTSPLENAHLLSALVPKHHLL